MLLIADLEKIPNIVRCLKKTASRSDALAVIVRDLLSKDKLTSNVTKATVFVRIPAFNKVSGRISARVLEAVENNEKRTNVVGWMGPPWPAVR